MAFMSQAVNGDQRWQRFANQTTNHQFHTTSFVSKVGFSLVVYQFVASRLETNRPETKQFRWGVMFVDRSDNWGTY